ncbi:PucR family transcriptional regulator [Virgibacillus oceani]|uniref:CdaR family transcriptional regulator n=1 Tax=Virgibacillus oceani TaxID=1479511 RepID=A0A917HH93_9BACI|nr:PucR family transcriptional regulator [Virgibacillus oceani]GGG78534.1 CdaR family transcriptional regulator [Virgibacillus oceani]
MSVLVKDILTLSAMKESRLLSGFRGVEKEVEKISVMESPEFERWAQPKSVLLTSLYATQNFTYDEQMDFLKRLDEEGISALIVKTEAYVKKVPKGIIDGGKKFQLPIIQISKNTHYNTVTHDVMQLLFNEENKKLNYFRKMYEKFMRLSIGGEDQQSIIRSLQKVISHPVFLLNDSGTTIVQTESISLPELNLDVQPMDLNDYLAVYQTKNAYIITIQMNEKNKLFLITATENKPVNPMEKIAIHIAASFIKLNDVKNESKHKEQERFKQSFDNLIHNASLSLSERNQALKIIGLEKGDSYQVIYVVAEGTNTKLLNQLDKHITLSFYNQVEIAKQWLGTGRIAYIIKKENVNIKPILYEIIEFFLNPLSEFHIGVSDIVNSSLDFNAAFIQAQEAIKLGGNISSKSESRIFFYSDIGINRTFYNLQKKVTLENYLNPKIKILMESPLRKKDVLQDTLLTYLDENNNFKNTAERLDVHWKTVKNRIVQIQDITGIDLKNPDEMLDIHFSLKLLIYLNATIE